MKTVSAPTLWIASILLASFTLGGLAGEPCKKMDASKCIEMHQQRAATIRENADKMEAELKKGSFPADKTKTIEEMISIGRQQADLNDQAAAALQRNDTQESKALYEKYKELETRKHALGEEMGWGKSDSKGASRKGEKKDPSTCDSKPSGSCKGGSEKTSGQSDSELQQWLSTDKK